MKRNAFLKVLFLAPLGALLAADAPPMIGGLPAGKVLFLGNSITLHSPKPDIGWTGNWGMAASAEEKDYVHLLTADIAKAAGVAPRTMVKNIADFERGYEGFDFSAGLKEGVEFRADIIVLAIGENVPAPATDDARTKFAAAFARLLAGLKQDARPAIFVRSSFWPHAVKDGIMRQASADAGATFVDISALGRDGSNAASAERKIEHAGVAGHPGDKGMRAIADAIFAAIRNRAGLGAAAEVTIRNDGELKAALASLKPGTILKLAPGEYAGDHRVRGVERVTIEALDPRNPPHFKGGGVAFQFSRCDGLTLRHIRVSGQRDDGINLDDGGDLARPVKGITIANVEVSDIGPRGNHDGIKGSGLHGLTIRDCTITGWGGQGIDLVGCHESLISGCRFMGKGGFTASAGVQMKGGSSGITVEKCEFTDAGERPVNVGGSTGPAYFRPQGAKSEASRIAVRDNVIEGGLAAAVFVGVDGAEFTGNTILFPTKWIFRVLQENTAEGMAPCRNVLVKNNRVIFRRSQVQTDVNIGGGTEPATFRFEGNHWFAEDRPDASRPNLPTAEKGGIHGADPRPTQPKRP